MLKLRPTIGGALLLVALIAVCVAVVKDPATMSLTAQPPAPPAAPKPPAPTGLRSTAVTSTAVWLTWDIPAGSAPASFRVLRDDNLVGTTINGTTNIFTTGVSPGRTYVFTVISVDAAGTQSADSNKITVNTPPLPGSAVPAILRPARDLQVSSATTNSITLYWTPSPDLMTSRVTSYSLILDGASYSIDRWQYTHTFGGLAPGSSHSVQLIAKGPNGLQSEPVSITAATLPSP